VRIKTSQRLRRFAVIAAIGLYASRLLVESSVLPSTGVVAALVMLAVSGAGFYVTELASHRGITLNPLLALYVYVLWPSPNHAVAAGAAVVAGIGYIMANRREPTGNQWSSISDFAIAAPAFALFTHTLSRTVLPADAGEFQLVSGVLGVAHPPGYPLYTMLGHLFTLLPLGEPAYCVNLFAAVTSALTLAVVARTVRRATGFPSAGMAAALVLAGSTTFWAQSTTANIRSMTALFTALSLLTLTDFIRDRSDRSLSRFALCFGLGVTHHSSLALLGLPFVAALAAADTSLVSSPRRWLRPLTAFAAPFILLLYLPIRSLCGTPFDPVPIRTFGDFVQHVLALGFRGDMLYFTTGQALRLRSEITLSILSLQFGWPLLLIGTAMFLVLLRRVPRLALLFGGVFLINVVSAITYRAPQTVEYLMPAYVALVCVIGCGFATLAVWLERIPAIGTIVLSLVLLLSGANLIRNYPSFIALSKDQSARDYAQSVLESAPPRTVILANWHHATVFWYLQQIEGRRQDVSVRYVYPEGTLSMAENTIRRIASEIEDRPVVVTNRYHEYDGTPYRFAPSHGAYLVQSGPSVTTSPEFSELGVELSDRIRMVGYQIDRLTLSPGEVLTVRIRWQPTVKLEHDYSFFVQVLGPEGVLGQGDITHQAARYETGEIVTDEYLVPLYLTTHPGEYDLITGAYFTVPEGGWQRLTTTEGGDHVTLPTIQVRERQSVPASQHPMRKAFANGVCLVGADMDRSVHGSQRLYLHWRVPGGLDDQPRLALHADGDLLASEPLPRLGQGGYLTTAHDLPADVIQLWVELVSGSSELPIPVLGPWNRPSGTRVSLPRWTANSRYVPLGGEMVLTGLQTDPDGPIAGATYRVQPTFLSQRAITNDYRVSVSLHSQSGSRYAQQDSVPAMGAIPTLKWVAGWSVEDPHVLEIPVDASGEAKLRLTVYDAFTQRPLAVLDDRLVRSGQGIHMDLATVQLEAPLVD